VKRETTNVKISRLSFHLSRNANVTLANGMMIYGHNFNSKK